MKAHPRVRLGINNRMEWAVLSVADTRCSVEDFFAGVDVWLKRPQVVNRRLLGAIILRERVLDSNSEPGGEWQWAYQLHRELQGSTKQGDQLYGISGEKLDSTVIGQEVDQEEDTHDEEHVTCLVRELLPKMKSMPPLQDTILIDQKNFTAAFCHLRCASPCTYPSIPCGCYKFQYCSVDPSKARISLSVYLCSSVSPSTDPLASQPLVCQNHPCDGVVTPTVDWLRTVLLPKVVQWAEENASHVTTTPRNAPLVPLDRYCKLYYKLKDKYGPPLVKNWPEATDPHKFVYEDIAIATYLLILWEEQRAVRGLCRKQSFVDLGCGNGLLVYLLSCEGHPGKGIDLRERKIWQLFTSKAQLEVCTLTPSSDTLFPEFDWLIGNHSDELTPWIPVMAARSSYSMSYFVLPCCAHDFDRKFCRPDTHKSQYHSYLAYIRLVGETMGFVVEEDVLRIPSSKRVCQVGRKRSYPPKTEASVDQLRQEFLDSRCSKKQGGHSEPTTPGKGYRVAALAIKMGEESSELEGRGAHVVSKDGSGSQTEMETEMQCTKEQTSALNLWAADFKPRPGKECVRNCSQIDRSVKEHIVETLARALLGTENWVDVSSLDGEVECVSGSSVEGGEQKPLCHTGANSLEQQLSIGERLWNRGGQLHLNDAVRLLDAGILRQLKQEIGGLQTLLRNHHQIFQVSGGRVKLRNWAMEEHHPRKPSKPRSERDAKLLVKTKLCWFHAHHPQGCPRPTSNCPYAHGLHELRERPDFSTVDPAILNAHPGLWR